MNNTNYFNVNDKIILITGASGILGLEYVKIFLDSGSKVVALDINISDKLSALKSDKLFIEKVDITSTIEIINLVTKIKNEIGIPDVLINNAALDSPPDSDSSNNGPFEEFSEDTWNKVFDVNVTSVFKLCKFIGKEMKQNGGGKIINISSIYGLVSPDQSIYDYKRSNGDVFYKPVAYSASKSSLINFTKYLAVYWAKDNIQVNTLVLAGVFNNQDSQFLNNYCSRIPIGRMANKNEYGPTLLYLASNASSYMTGSELVLDGGWTAI